MKVNVKRLTPDAFAPYGTVAVLPAGAPTAATDAFSFWSDVVHYRIEGETEIGFCTVYRQAPPQVSWMERHARTPEILVPIDAPLLLPVMPGGGSARDVEVFRIDPGEAVMIGQNEWHSACHPVGRDAATYLVIFRRGTPQEDVTKTEVARVKIEA